MLPTYVPGDSVLPKEKKNVVNHLEWDSGDCEFVNVLFFLFSKKKTMHTLIFKNSTV